MVRARRAEGCLEIDQGAQFFGEGVRFPGMIAMRGAEGGKKRGKEKKRFVNFQGVIKISLMKRCSADPGRHCRVR